MLDNAADGITVIIKKVHITVYSFPGANSRLCKVATLGPTKTTAPNPFTPPTLVIEVRDLNLRATNSRWEVRFLTLCNIYCGIGSGFEAIT